MTAVPATKDADSWGDDDWEEYMWGREHAPYLDFETKEGGSLRIYQNLQGGHGGLGSAEGLHTTVWEAAVALYLYALKEDRVNPGCWNEKRVLELGSESR